MKRKTEEKSPKAKRSKSQIGMLVVLVVVMLAADLPVIAKAGGLERGPIVQTQVVKEHRAEWWFATYNEWLTDTSDATATYIQSFEGVDEWPTGWGYETWSICKTQVPDSSYHQMKYLVRAGGTWSSWADVDTTLASDFTLGATGHRFKRLTLPAVKPWALQFRDVQVDGSSAYSTAHYHILYTWPE